MAEIADFCDHAVLLDFSGGIENPIITFLGGELAAECGNAVHIRRLSDVPGTSLLSRIADHYVQILAYQAPVGFEAEFDNRANGTTLFRGMLLPFGDASGVISHVLGVINWKEMADEDMATQLLAEIRQAYVPEAIGQAPVMQAAGIASLLSPLLAASRPVAKAPALIDWLVSARSMARIARLRADSGHLALYAAIGAAWDFATVLSHAERLDIAPGALAGWLAAAPGGVKGVLQDERRARKSGKGRLTSRHSQLAERLRRIRARPLSSLDPQGPEFSVVLTRRLPNGQVVMLGETSADEALLARVARHLPG